ncbi:TetR/AcrR family transcriptional regulator [Actinomadura darangshiensis]|uniref:TetR/AcrR family transcriptional regulator n=1 Tax=Actinomadura darangshiensis TaxID=705336 RepID=A0A4R5AI59_9ACTN|nr:TetR family transcriptional regulator [Actinomadura darangshiensis]TDD71160.1 TetR/AcrR family transcriptional regulator [Actinomadura darangshiensis]
MRSNPARRAALLDAAIEVLAREGTRGLTLRAIDAQAGVPTGTATNYFANRADLLAQVMHRTRERLTPDPAALAETMRQAPTHDLVTELMRQLLERMRGDRTGYLAMLELRLEATRRPELHADLSGFLTAEHEEIVRYHLDAGLPGDATGVALLYFAMAGLLLDDLTVPAILEPYSTTGLIGQIVTRLLPAQG